MGPCIFCFQSEPDVSFSREHIIPQSIGGCLVLTNYVCKKCNDLLGQNVDHAILKNPDVIRALEQFDLPHNRVQLIKHNYDVRGFADGLEVIGRAAETGFEIPTQRLLDGSLIQSDSDLRNILFKSAVRDPQLKKMGVTRQQIDRELDRIEVAYGASNVGEPIESPLLGKTLVKRSTAFSIELTPKGMYDVSPLVAKVCYEFGFFVGYSDFLQSENVARSLLDYLLTGEQQDGLHIIRLLLDEEPLVPIHSIALTVSNQHTYFTVRFFGRIAYRVFAPPFENDVLQHIRDEFDCTDIIGLEFQQDLENGIARFWGVLPDESVKHLCSW